MTRAAAHLWEVDHPYYMAEGCFYSNGHHHTYDSFTDFLDEWADYSENMNLVFRWDWNKPNPTYYNSPADIPEHDELCIYFVMQRKAFTTSCYIKVTEADEPAVLKYLAPKARHIARLWEPIWQAASV